MPSDRHADVYREREKQWRAAAEALPPGEERDTNLSLAEGYARLVDFIEARQRKLNGASVGASVFVQTQSESPTKSW